MDSQKQQPTPPGQKVDLGGFRLHALVSGQGAPSVVLEPALGGFALQYAYIRKGVSAFTRVVAYDRAGQGWSDPSPNPRTPEHLAGELHALLAGLGLPPPYVLAGHSYGGLLTRVYAGFYPQEVAGIVLIDSTHEDEYEIFPNIDKMTAQLAFGVRLVRLAARLGLAKPLTRLSLGSAAKAFSREDLDTFLSIASQPKHHQTVLAEFSQHRRFYGAQSEVPRTLGDTPLVVVTAGSSVSGRGKVGGMTADQVNARHQQLQQSLACLSTRGEQIIIPNATHFSIFTQPDHANQVVEAIRRLVEHA